MAPAPQYLTLAEPSEPTRPRQLAFYEWGDKSNAQVVVCVHGLSRNGRDFDFLAEALAARYRIISIDMAGRGKSDWLSNKTDYNYVTYVADCTALMNALGLASVSWIGTSMGGIIGMMMAAGQPQRIKRMVINDIGAVVSGAGLKRIMSYVGASGAFANAGEALAYIKGTMAPFGIRTEKEWQHMFAISFEPLANGKYALAYDPGISAAFRASVSAKDGIADVDLSAVWNAVTCPALILHGKDSDILTHATATAMCVRSAPTTLVEFDGVGHAPALLDSAQIKVITDWLDNRG